MAYALNLKRFSGLTASIGLAIIAGQASFTVPALAQSSDVQLCHIANAGFFITDGDKAVLIDALMDEGLDGYPTPSPALEAAMEAGEAPFNNIAAVIATHRHYDHFNPVPVLNHMRANESTQYVLTPESVDILFDHGLPKDREHVRVHAEMPSATGGAPISYEFDGVGVDVYYVSHGDGRDIQNIGVRVKLGGKTFFHPGDIFWNTEGLKGAGISGLQVDYLLIPHWYTMDEERQAEMAAAFDARHIVPMHLPMEGRTRQWITDFGGLEAVIDASFALYDNSLRLTAEMECVVTGD